MNLGTLRRKMKEIAYLLSTSTPSDENLNNYLRNLAKCRAYLYTHTPPQDFKTQHQLALQQLNIIEVKIGLIFLKREGMQEDWSA